MSQPTTEGVASLLAGTAVFFVLKLTTSVDDVLWLSPFLAIADDDIRYKLYCGLLYGAICILVTLEALFIDVAASYGLGSLIKALDHGGGGDDDIDQDDRYWTASRLLCVLASIGIAACACKEWKDSREEEGDIDEEKDLANEDVRDYEMEAGRRTQIEKEIQQLNGAGENSDGGEEPTIQTDPLSESRRSSYTSDGEYKSFAQRGGDPFAEKENCLLEQEQQHETQHETHSVRPPHHVRVKRGATYDKLGGDSEALHLREAEGSRHEKVEKRTLSSLLVVAFFGTLDDLALFAAVLMGEHIRYISLLCGSLLAAFVIVLTSWCVSLFKPFANAMQRIPLWAILLAIALYILLDGLLG